MPEDLGKRIRKLRAEKGLTLEEVSKALGVSRQTIYKYESGVITNIPSDKIEIMAKLFGVSPAQIMGWEEIQVEIKPQKKSSYTIYEDSDFTILSASRRLEESQRKALRQSLIICTSPVDQRPSRVEILNWLNEHVRLASFNGSNYEDRDDESLYRLYKELRNEADGN